MLSEIKLILSIYVELYLKGNIIVILYYINRLHKRASFSNEDFFFPRSEYDIDFIMQRNIAVFWMMKTNTEVWFSKILPKYGGFVFFNKKCLELILTLLNIIVGNKIGLKLLSWNLLIFILLMVIINCIVLILPVSICTSLSKHDTIVPYDFMNIPRGWKSIDYRILLDLIFFFCFLHFLI